MGLLLYTLFCFANLVMIYNPLECNFGLISIRNVSLKQLNGVGNSLHIVLYFDTAIAENS